MKSKLVPIQQLQYVTYSFDTINDWSKKSNLV